MFQKVFSIKISFFVFFKLFKINSKLSDLLSGIFANESKNVVESQSYWDPSFEINRGPPTLYRSPRVFSVSGSSVFGVVVSGVNERENESSQYIKLAILLAKR